MVARRSAGRERAGLTAGPPRRDEPAGPGARSVRDDAAVWARVNSRRARAVLLGAAGALLLGAPGAGAAGISALRGPSLWIVHAGEPAAIAVQARQAGVRTLLVKAADGTTPDPQFSPALVSALRASGLTVCGWTFAYGSEPAAEAAAAVASVRAGAQCLVVDAEGEYDSRYGSAQVFVRSLRSALGPGFPIALAGQAETFQHPKFPYSVFLGPGAFQLDMPQIYWHDLGLSVPAAYRLAIAENALYGRPIVPVGQLYGGVGAQEVAQFAALADEYGSPGASFFDLDSAEPALLAAVVPRLRPDVRIVARPSNDPARCGRRRGAVGAGAAQRRGGATAGRRLLRRADARALVTRFQARHDLRRSGILDAPTWRALLRVRPRVPSWARRPPDSAL